MLKKNPQGLCRDADVAVLDCFPFLFEETQPRGRGPGKEARKGNDLLKSKHEEDEGLSAYEI